MTQATYGGVLSLAAGAFLLFAVLIVWRRELRAIVKLLAGSFLIALLAVTASSFLANPTS